MDDLYTVRQVAHAIGVSDGTVRSWSSRYADHLSDHATPPEGDERRYTEGDLTILQSVATLREQHSPHNLIEAKIAAGERYEPLRTDDQQPPKTADTGQSGAPGEPVALVPHTMLDRIQAIYDGSTEQLRRQLEAERQAHEATRDEVKELLQKVGELTGELRAVKGAQTADNAPQPAPAGERADDAAAELERLRRERDDAERRAKEATRRAEEAERPAPRFGRLFDRFRRE